MGSEMCRHTCTTREISEQDLESGIAHGSFHVNDTIWCHVRKEKVVVLKLSPYLGFQESFPTWKVSAHIDFRDIILLIDIVDIAFLLLSASRSTALA